MIHLPDPATEHLPGEDQPISTDDLREQVAQALGTATTDPYTVRLADALAPIVREAQGRAWDEGWADRATYDPSDHEEPIFTNPYTERINQ